MPILDLFFQIACLELFPLHVILLKDMKNTEEKITSERASS
jgi:hypothetical protein